MARNRGKKALYEVMGSPGGKPDYRSTVEPLRSSKPCSEEHGVAESAVIPEKPLLWPTRPRLFQFNAGRVEISMPYQLAIAMLLGIVLIVLVVFRLGQSSVKLQDTAMVTVSPIVVEKPVQIRTVKPKSPLVVKGVARTPTEPENVVRSEQGGNNKIVIQTSLRRADLVPAQKFFADNGIETEIKQIDRRYYLLSKQKYQSTNKFGTDGYKALRKIKELGSTYKAPDSGYGNFGKRPFHDAYGMKFND